MILAVMLAFCGRLGAQTYDYLTFQTSDGALHSIKTSGLVITFSDGQMKATAGSENLSLSLTELTKMYFSDTNGVDMAEMTGRATVREHLPRQEMSWTVRMRFMENTSVFLFFYDMQMPRMVGKCSCAADLCLLCPNHSGKLIII